MQITPGLGVSIMMNNYFHDVATALLAGSAFTLNAIARVQAVQNNAAGTLFFIRAYDMMAKFFRFAIWWIMLGGIPRIIFYTSFELANAADRRQIPALMVKHALMFLLLVWGFIAWRRLKCKIDDLRATVSPDSIF